MRDIGRDHYCSGNHYKDGWCTMGDCVHVDSCERCHAKRPTPGKTASGLETGMIPEQVKENLLKLHECPTDFAVVFSGKKHGKVNGTYKPLEKMITIHNRNFEGNDGLLFYTAMHELAHHIQFTEHGKNGTRSHTQLFYSILDDLVDKAEELGIWEQKIDKETKALIDEAGKISLEIAALQRKLGHVLFKLNESCRRNKIRYEDVLDRQAKITDGAGKKLMKIALLDLPPEIGFDTQEAVASVNNKERQEAMLAAVADNKSAAQVKQAGARIKPEKEELNDAELLLKEKKQIEKQIASLKRRLESIVLKIKKLEGGG